MKLGELKINRDLFTVEEIARLESAIASGEFSKLMNCLDNIDPAKELEMQRVINSLAPNLDEFESEVKKEMEKALPNGPQSPEEEAEWEVKLQAEFREYAEKLAKRKKANEKNLTSKEKLEDMENEIDNLKEVRSLEAIQEELTSKLQEIKSLKPKQNKTEEEKALYNKLKKEIANLQNEEKLAKSK